MSTGTDRAMIRRGTAVSLGLLVVFLAGWQWGLALLGIPSFIIPPLSAVFDEFLRMRGMAWRQAQQLGGGRGRTERSDRAGDVIAAGGMR